MAKRNPRLAQDQRAATAAVTRTNRSVSSPTPTSQSIRRDDDATRKRRAIAWQTHPRYIEWLPVWRELGFIYEGDGPYSNGNALVPHPRELKYQTDLDGNPNYDVVIGEMPKFTRRKQLACYLNFAQAIVDTIVDHLFAKRPARMVEPLPDGSPHPLMKWWENVDGFGTSMTDWLRQEMTMAAVYGFEWVVMDRMGSPTTPVPMSAAEQGQLVLRSWIPPDCLDWLAPRGRIAAAKFIEAKERVDLSEVTATTTLPGSGQMGEMLAQDTPDVEFFLWDSQAWVHLDRDGGEIKRANHGFGECPVVPLYCRKRARVPVIGRSLLRDPRTFRDHYNQYSELRELERSQTFSIFQVLLGPEETVAEAAGRLGSHSGTDTVIFTKGGASYVTPDSGPVTSYLETLEKLERAIFRLIGLPFDGDGHSAETADSRRIKAMDLNRTLAGMAAHLERFEHTIARLWFRGEYGAEIGYNRWKETPVTISYPDEFYVQQIVEAITDLREATSVRLGATANATLRKRVIPVVLPDLDDDTAAIIEAEIEEDAQAEAELNRAMEEGGAMQAMGLGPDGEPVDQGEDEGGTEDGGTGAGAQDDASPAGTAKVKDKRKPGKAGQKTPKPPKVKVEVG